MKKLYFLITMVLVAGISFGQTILTEDFGGGSFPPSGWTIDAHSENWSANNGATAGGTPPEADFNWSPQFNGTTRLISPEVDATGMENMMLSFKHAISHYSNSYQIGVATRSAGGDWNTAWSQTIASNQDAQTISVELNTDDAGADDFQFCLYFQGNSYDINDWYIDDIELFNAFDLDMQMNAITTPTYVAQGDVEVTGILLNKGATEITSFDVNYTYNGTDTYTSSYTGESIAPLEQFNFTCEDLWSATPGSYDLTVWVNNVNGGEDDNPDNDELTKSVSVATQSVQRAPLYEEFTSSTCDPCEGFNSGTFNPFIEEHGDEIVLVKYQMDWPGSGDPYYTEEGGVRRGYYGVSYVPDLYAGGIQRSTDDAGVNGAFDELMAKPAFMDVSGNFNIDGTIISGTVNIDPYISAEDLTLHIIVIEHETTGNVGSNGETEFHNVMMKMIPDANGASVDLTTGELFSTDFEQELSGTNVEEYDDLMVVVFVQNNENKEVMQSAYAEEGAGAPLSTVNIEDGAIDVPTDHEFVITFTQSVRELDDTELNDDNVDGHVIFNYDDESGEAVAFDATINEEKTEITVIPDGLLDTEQTFYLGMEATLENYSDVAIEPWAITFETEVGIDIENIGVAKLNAYPNPVENVATISFEMLKQSDVNVQVMNTAGQVLYRATLNDVVGQQSIIWNAETVKSGMYFCNIRTNEGTTTVKLSVK